MIPHWKYNEYFNMSEDSKEFTQRMLFMEYVEEWERSEFHGDPYSLTVEFVKDQVELEQNEEYETCQLYMDTFVRFQKQFKEFG